MLSAKTNLNTMVVLISKAFIKSYTNHDEFISVNALREYNENKEDIKNTKNPVEYAI